MSWPATWQEGIFSYYDNTSLITVVVVCVLIQAEVPSNVETPSSDI